MRKIDHLIVNSFLACPYCMRELRETWHSCCGEVGHSETAYELSTGETVLGTELETLTLKDIGDL